VNIAETLFEILKLINGVIFEKGLAVDDGDVVKRFSTD